MTIRMNFSSFPTVLRKLLLLAILSQTSAAAQSRAAVPSFDFKGRFLLATSDADMRPSAYLDGKLGPADGADALTVIRLDRPGRELRPVAIPVTNSVTGPPAVVAVTPDGRYAVVIETRGPRPALANPLLKDLPPGRTVTVVDLIDPDHPKVTQRVRGGE